MAESCVVEQSEGLVSGDVDEAAEAKVESSFPLRMEIPLHPFSNFPLLS